MLKSLFNIINEIFLFLLTLLLIVSFNILNIFVINDIRNCDSIYVYLIYLFSGIYVLLLFLLRLQKKTESNNVFNIVSKYKFFFLMPLFYAMNNFEIYSKLFCLIMPVLFYFLISIMKNFNIINKLFFSLKRSFIYILLFAILDLPFVIFNIMAVFDSVDYSQNYELLILYLFFSLSYKYLPFYLVNLYKYVKNK